MIAADAPLSRLAALLAVSATPRPSHFPPVDTWLLRAAIRELLAGAPRTGLFTSLERPVWGGWATPPMVAFHLPEHLREASFKDADSLEDIESGYYVGEVMMEMEEDGWLEKRLCHPFAHHTSPDVAATQDWEFRLVGDQGYCLWLPSLPVSAETRDGWEDMVNRRHLANLRDTLASTDSTVPPYILSRIERYRQHKTKRRVVLQ